MENTLANGSNIFKLKWKFFTYRIVSYFSFLLIPVYVQKGLELRPIALAALMTLYILFIVSQWFLLGKEIDHRLKIYFRVLYLPCLLRRNDPYVNDSSALLLYPSD